MSGRGELGCLRPPRDRPHALVPHQTERVTDYPTASANHRNPVRGDTPTAHEAHITTRTCTTRGNRPTTNTNSSEGCRNDPLESTVP